MELRVGDSTVCWLTLHHDLGLTRSFVGHGLEAFTSHVYLWSNITLEVSLCSTKLQVADVGQLLHNDASLHLVNFTLKELKKAKTVPNRYGLDCRGHRIEEGRTQMTICYDWEDTATIVRN
jgi:hypothetical protein